MRLSRRDLLKGGSAFATIPLGLGGRLQRGLDNAIMLEARQGSSSGPSPITLSLGKAKWPTVIDTFGTPATGGTPPYSFNKQFSTDGGVTFTTYSDASFDTSPDTSFRGLPPNTSVICEVQTVDSTGATSAWAQLTQATPAYPGMYKVQLAGVGGRPAYTCYVGDNGNVVQNITTNVPGGTVLSVFCPAYRDGGSLTGQTVNAPTFGLVGGTQLQLTSVPLRTGVVSLQFEVQDGGGNTHTLSAFLAILCNAPVDTTTAPVPYAGNIAFVTQGLLNGNLVLPSDRAPGFIVATADFNNPQNANSTSSSQCDAFAEVAVNPGFAFAVEYEWSNSVLLPWTLSTVRIKQVNAIAAGTYTLVIAFFGSHPYPSWQSSHVYNTGDWFIDASTKYLYQATVGGTSTSGNAPNLTTVGSTVTGSDGITWELVSVEAQLMGRFLPCLLSINVVVPASASKPLTSTYNNTAPITSAFPWGGNIAQIGGSGFTPTSFALLPDPSSRAASKYTMDPTGQVRSAHFAQFNLFDNHAVGVVASASGNTVTVGGGSYPQTALSPLSFAQAYAAYGSALYLAGPNVPPLTQVTGVSGNTITTNQSMAAVPVGAIITASKVSLTTGQPKCVPLSAGLDTAMIVAADNSGNVGWMQWRNYVSFPTPQSGYTSYVIGSASPNSYPTDCLDGLFGKLFDEWSAWATSGTAPPSAGCKITLVGGAGDWPDGTFSLNGYAGSGVMSTVPLPVKIVGIPTGTAPNKTLPKIWFPKPMNDATIEGALPRWWDLFMQLVEIDGPSEFTASYLSGAGGDNLDTFAGIQYAYGSLFADLIYAHNADSFIQRGSYVDNVTCTNSLLPLFGNNEPGLPLETLYTLTDQVTLSSVFAVANNGADQIKQRGRRMLANNVASLDGNEGGASKLLGNPCGGDWTLGTVVLHRSMSAYSSEVFNPCDETKHQWLDNDLTVLNATIVNDIWNSSLSTASSLPMCYYVANCGYSGRTNPITIQMPNLQYWSGIKPTGFSFSYPGQVYGISLPPWINATTAGVTTDGVNPVSPVSLSNRPDLTQYYQAPPLFAALGISLGSPDPHYTPRLANNGSYTGPFNIAAPFQDIYTMYGANGSSAQLGLGFEPKVPHAASGVIATAQLLPSTISLSTWKFATIAAGSTSLSSWAVDGIYQITQGLTIASNPWFSQIFPSGETGSFPTYTATLTSATIKSGGSGYPASTTVTLTLSGGTFTTAAQVSATTNSSGQVTAINSVTTAGAYTIPTNTPCPTTTGGSGSGCTLAPVFSTSYPSENLTLSQPTISPIPGAHAPGVSVINVSIATWAANVFTCSVGSAAAQGDFAVGDLVQVQGFLPASLNGFRTISGLTNVSGTYYLTFAVTGGGSVTANGIITKRNIMTISGIPTSEIEWGMPEVLTESGNTTCLTIDPTTGNISYDGSQPAGSWYAYSITASFYGSNYWTIWRGETGMFV